MNPEYIGEKSIWTVGVGQVPGAVVTELVASVVGSPASSMPPLAAEVDPELAVPLVAVVDPEVVAGLPLPELTAPRLFEPELPPGVLLPPQAERHAPSATRLTLETILVCNLKARFILEPALSTA
jgi:hypothetical protein